MSLRKSRRPLTLVFIGSGNGPNQEDWEARMAIIIGGQANQSGTIVRGPNETQAEFRRRVNELAAPRQGLKSDVPT
jgi:hypothetical protein